MNNQEIVAKLWNLCNVLRDDGITYHQYVTELTYILFLKMCKETGTEGAIPDQYRWDKLLAKQGVELKKFYKELLEHLGESCTGRVREIYQGAQSNIDEPKNLEKIIQTIDQFDWYTAKEEGLGNLYEGLLEKNANEKKSGAGQYFTPRVLIDVMTELIKPQLGDKCFDPACGTFGFMIAANRYVNAHNDMYALSDRQADFQQNKAFNGVELVHETHRLALMNAYLHNMNANITLGDSLAQSAKGLKDFDVILTNPPFGTKKGGERATRDDISFQTSNKQLNFLQVIYRSLKADGKARCAVVLPDNVLFAAGDGASVRRELMNFCNLHTILRLPTGIFYAQGVKTNVLFFTRGTTEQDNTTEVAFYDMRTNMDSFGKTRQLRKSDFDEFVAGYEDPSKRTGERWSKFTREEIAKNPDDSLDLGLIRDDSIVDYDDLPDPVESTRLTVNPPPLSASISALIFLLSTRIIISLKFMTSISISAILRMLTSCLVIISVKAASLPFTSLVMTSIRVCPTPKILLKVLKIALCVTIPLKFPFSLTTGTNCKLCSASIFPGTSTKSLSLTASIFVFMNSATLRSKNSSLSSLLLKYSSKMYFFEMIPTNLLP